MTVHYNLTYPFPRISSLNKILTKHGRWNTRRRLKVHGNVQISRIWFLIFLQAFSCFRCSGSAACKRNISVKYPGVILGRAQKTTKLSTPTNEQTFPNKRENTSKRSRIVFQSHDLSGDLPLFSGGSMGLAPIVASHPLSSTPRLTLIDLGFWIRPK